MEGYDWVPLLPMLLEVILVAGAARVARKSPGVAAVLGLLLAVGAGYASNKLWAVSSALSPLNVDGSAVAGAPRMMAAVFDLNSREHRVRTAQVPVPNHNDDQLLVRVAAAGLNPSNFKLNLAAIPFVRHFRDHVVGYDVAGEVLSVGHGQDCTGLEVGDVVFGFTTTGSIAQYAALACRMAAVKPVSITASQAASLPVAALTSMMAWDRTVLAPGQAALVVGASGGCGLYGVALAKILGATTTGICSTRNLGFVRGLGADRVVDYTDRDAMAALREEGRQFDVIYDTVSSPAPEDPDYSDVIEPLLKPGGRIVAINGSPLDWTRGVVEKFVLRGLLGLEDVSIQRPGFDLFLLTPARADLERLVAWFDQGALPTPPIDSAFYLSREGDLERGFARMKSRRTVGKIVFEFPVSGHAGQQRHAELKRETQDGILQALDKVLSLGQMRI